MSTTITIQYPPARLKDKASKKQDEEFVRTVCALANSTGGRIVLCAKENERYSDKDVDDITRKLEQKTSDAFGFLTAVETISQEKVSGDEEPSELIFNVKAWPTSRQPCTVNYNLYLTTESQVKHIDSSETVEKVVENIIEKKRKRKEDFAFGSHHRCFAFAEAMPLRESKDTQFKCLKDEKSNKCDIVTRMQSNKLTSYVAAFANGDGGHIYYGIKTHEDGPNVVEGQMVKNREKIASGVEKTIKKMLWPKDCGEPKKGKHWEIFFEPVSGDDEKCDSKAKFVIVIAVAPSPLPVFAEKPESYHVVNGQVERLNYTEWEKRLRRHLISDRPPIVDIPTQVGRCEWSSEEAQQLHFTVLHELVQLRNQGDEAFFKRITELQETVDHTGNVKIVVQQQEAAYYFRKGDFQEAETRLVENEGDIGKSLDVKIHEVRRLYWLSVVKLSQGKLRESDELSTNALQNAELVPPMLIGAWLLENEAGRLEIDIATSYNPTEPQNCDDLITQCFDKYYEALGQADVAQDSPKSGLVQLKQRVHINLARIYLGSFRGKETITRTTGCQEDHHKKAVEMLATLVRWSDQQGWTMTLFCKCEYLLARCEQNIRNWERFGNPEFFKKACKNSSKALRKAEKNNFKSICCYAKEQHAYLGIELKL